MLMMESMVEYFLLRGSVIYKRFGTSRNDVPFRMIYRVLR